MSISFDSSSESCEACGAIYEALSFTRVMLTCSRQLKRTAEQILVDWLTSGARCIGASCDKCWSGFRLDWDPKNSDTRTGRCLSLRCVMPVPSKSSECYCFFHWLPKGYALTVGYRCALLGPCCGDHGLRGTCQKCQDYVVNLRLIL